MESGGSGMTLTDSIDGNTPANGEILILATTQEGKWTTWII